MWSGSTRFLSGDHAISEKPEARRETPELIPRLALFFSRLGLTVWARLLNFTISVTLFFFLTFVLQEYPCSRVLRLSSFSLLARKCLFTRGEIIGYIAKNYGFIPVVFVDKFKLHIIAWKSTSIIYRSCIKQLKLEQNPHPVQVCGKHSYKCYYWYNKLIVNQYCTLQSYKTISPLLQKHLSNFLIFI